MSKKDDGDDDGGKGFKASQLNIDINNNGSESNASDSSNLVSSALTSNMGNSSYNPNDGILFKSLNLIEKEIFYSGQSSSNGRRIIQDALVYLNYSLYK